MKKDIEIFDPPMCCSSGVCGPDLDPDLPRFAAELDALKRQGVTVTRHNLAREPLAFAQNTLVRETLQEDERCLPLVLLNGRVVSRGKYPSPGMLAVALAEQAPEDDDETGVPDYLGDPSGKEAVHDA